MHATLDFLENDVHSEFSLPEKHKEVAREYIRKGMQFLPQILSGDYRTQSDSYPQEVRRILAVSWVLYHMAVEKGQGYDQGMLVVEDKNEELFKYFSGAKSSYSRTSTHFPYLKGTFSSNQFGIDIEGQMSQGETQWEYIAPRFFSSSSQRLPLLPARKSHILFGQLPSGQKTGLESSHIFIRFEDHGMGTLRETFEHTKDYLSIHSRFFPNRVTGGHFIRTEHMLDELIDLYVAFLQQMGKANSKGELSLEQERSHARDLGLRYVMKRINEISPKSDELSDEACSLYDRMVLYYRYLDNIDARTGWEVILSDEELRESL